MSNGWDPDQFDVYICQVGKVVLFWGTSVKTYNYHIIWIVSTIITTVVSHADLVMKVKVVCIFIMNVECVMAILL